MDPKRWLSFEQPIGELEQRLESLQEQEPESPERTEQIRSLRRQLATVTEQVFNNLSAWQTVEVARHEKRPHTADYLRLVCDEFVELHGDRNFGDDQAIRAGLAKIEQFKVMIIGHQKGRTYKERSACYFGCAHPEGYRKAMAKMKLAAKYQIPVVTLIDTPGAYPGIGAEERGQAWVIAENMYEMSRLRTPIICVVIGEGGSGGALGLGVGDRIAMLQHAYYSVISPEGCAGILWKSHEYKETAAEALRFTSANLKRLGVIDDIIEEPLGGAHQDHQQTALRLKEYLVRTLRELAPVSIDDVISNRYAKFRRMGIFLEDATAESGSDVSA
ncbi:MAG: acetyl-CoA carboxylase carboxyl transferase subunit alpha [Planctomycetaceae bacterium]|nr:acetyl-CoA carboxylase carboxyl transferase subunit alpha [Planctomycetaceae bacterium]